MKKFEYKIINATVDTLVLDNYGKEGWELVHVQNANGKYYYYFKREL